MIWICYHVIPGYHFSNKITVRINCPCLAKHKIHIFNYSWIITHSENCKTIEDKNHTRLNFDQLIARLQQWMHVAYQMTSVIKCIHTFNVKYLMILISDIFSTTNPQMFKQLKINCTSHIRLVTCQCNRSSCSVGKAIKSSKSVIHTLFISFTFFAS